MQDDFIPAERYVSINACRDDADLPHMSPVEAIAADPRHIPHYQLNAVEEAYSNFELF
jgi:hypothetical protein